MDAAASGNIQVDSAIRVRYVIALEILAGVQEHGVCRVSGLLEDGREAQQILSSTEDIPICIIRKDEWNEILFRGIVRRAEIYTVNGVYHTRIDAVTVSEKLDRVKMQRSFQDVTMTYEQVAGRVLEPYGDMGATFVEEAKQAVCVQQCFDDVTYQMKEYGDIAGYRAAVCCPAGEEIAEGMQQVTV